MRLGFIQNYGFDPQSPTASSVTSPASRFTSNTSSTSSGSDPKQRLGSRQPSTSQGSRTLRKPPTPSSRQRLRQPQKPTPQSKPKIVKKDPVKPRNEQLVSEEQQKEAMVAEFMALLEEYKADKSAAGKVAEFYNLILESNLFKESELLGLKEQAEAISDEYDRLAAAALEAQVQQAIAPSSVQKKQPVKIKSREEQIETLALLYYNQMLTEDGDVVDDAFINALIANGWLDNDGYILFQQELAKLQAADAAAQEQVHQATNVVPTNVQPMSTAAATEVAPAEEEKEWYQKTSNQIIMGVALLALGFGATKLIK